MQKLLSLVLSISILFSSVTPAWSQIRGVSFGAIRRGMGRGLSAGVTQETSSALSTALTRNVYARLAFANSTLRKYITSGQTAGLAQQVLSLPVSNRANAIRQDFVTLSLIPSAVSIEERMQAGALLEANLTNAKIVFARVTQANLRSFLKVNQSKPKAVIYIQIQNILADAAALALVGTKEQAPALFSFYEQARGTLFEGPAALIAARGLLRMEAYEEFSELLSQQSANPVLNGVAKYAKQKEIPVEIPIRLQRKIVPPAVDEDFASFLAKPFYPNRLHADASLKATQEWFDMQQTAEISPVAPQTNTVQTFNKLEPIQPAAIVNEPVQIQENPISLASVEPGALASEPVKEESMPQAAPVVTPTVVEPAKQPTTSHEGIVYGGIPVFAIIDASKQALNWMRKKLAKKADKNAAAEQDAATASEEPGLHDNKGHLILGQVEDVPSRSSIGGDLVGVGNVKEVLVGVDGFQLTVEGEDKVEHILRNVDLTVSADLKNFSPEFNRLALDTKHIFELRNGSVSPQRPDHFFFALSPTNGAFDSLIHGTQALGLTRPMRIKIQQTSSPKKSVTVPVYKYVDKTTVTETALVAEVDASLLRGVKNPEGGRIVWVNKDVYGQETLLYQEDNGDFRSLQNAFVRLPKAESKYWIQILKMYPQQPFHLTVLSTEGKMIPVTYLVPSLQIGLGKTLSPVLKDRSTFTDDEASHIMMGINNVLPAFMGLVHPILKRYGEAAVFRVGTAMFGAGGMIALASGLYGHLGEGIMSNWQLAGFLTSSVLIALGTNITRFVQNLLMSANRGIVPQANSFQKVEVVTQTEPITYDANHLAKRTWEVLTKKSSKSLRDVVYYQRGAMFKNLGTALFLSFPWLANMAGRAFGYDLGLDFSASYVPYALYSMYVLRKVYKTRYKDAFPTNTTILTNNLQDLQNSTAVKIAEVPPAELTAQHPVLVAAAQQLKGAIEALVPVESRKLRVGTKGLTLKHEAEVAEELKNLLLLAGRTVPQAEEASANLQQIFDVLDGRDLKWYQKMAGWSQKWGKTFAMKGLPPALAAMTLATFGELGLSNGLAFAMREMLGKDNATAATGIVGILLYGCMFGWRVIGNFISQRMSGGSMYALSSSAGIAGPLLMALAKNTGDMGLLIGGAIMACFGISNFFSQMYEYMVGLHPKYKREIALLINYTMPVAAIPVGVMQSDWFKGLGIPGLDMALCGAALAASVALTPKMLANSSFVEFVKYEWKKLTAKFHKGSGEDTLPPAEPAAAQ